MKSDTGSSSARPEQVADLHAVSLQELRNLAFQDNHLHAFGAWLGAPVALQAQALEDRYVLVSVCQGAVRHLEGRLPVDPEGGAAFVAGLVAQVDRLAALATERKTGFNQQWFQALDILSRTCLDNHLLSDARTVVEIAIRTGCDKFPGLAQSLSITDAQLKLVLGQMPLAEEVALRYVSKPYLMPSRASRPIMYLSMLPILAKTGHIREFREVVWRGLTGYYSDPELRAAFQQRALSTYRGFVRTLLRSEVPVAARWIFLLQVLTEFARRRKALKSLGIYSFLRSTLWSQLYLRNYLSGTRPYALREGPMRWLPPLPFTRGGGGRKKILVTRAMGGMGDLIMMVPGLIALKRKHPDKEIHFAVQKGFFPLFHGIDEFVCRDVADTSIDLRDYVRWYDLTDCPAARIEGLQYPRVRSNRIAIFASAMGVNLKRLRKSGVLPTYVVSEAEAAEADAVLAGWNPEGLPVIGIQPFSADTYKNWPAMEQLASTLSKSALVLVFHNEAFPGYEGEGIRKVILPVRKSFALAAKCGLIVAPDSSFVHLGAALRVPTVAIFGPTSGRVFTKYYESIVKVVAPSRDTFACSPCWRNENKPCAISQDRESVCLRSIDADTVIARASAAPPTRWEKLREDVAHILW